MIKCFENIKIAYRAMMLPPSIDFRIYYLNLQYYKELTKFLILMITFFILCILIYLHFAKFNEPFNQLFFSIFKKQITKKYGRNEILPKASEVCLLILFTH